MRIPIYLILHLAHGDAPDITDTFCEPHIPIWACCDISWATVSRGRWCQGNCVTRGNAPDCARIGGKVLIGEPEVARLAGFLTERAIVSQLEYGRGSCRNLRGNPALSIN